MERFVFTRAEPQDSPQILEILEEEAFPGRVSLRYTRRPDAWASLRAEGDEVDIVVCRDTGNGKVIGFGASALQELFLAGCPVRAGYLFGLRIRREYLRTYSAFHRGYALMRELQRDKGVRVYYTTILAENQAAIRFLEKRRRTMPEYRFQGQYEVYALKTGRSGGRREKSVSFRRCTAEDIPSLVKLLEEAGRRHCLAPVVREDFFSTGLPSGLSLADFYILSRLGEPVACGALWDQRSYKQLVLKDYGGILKWLYPASFLLPLFGYPPILSKPGSVLPFFTLSYWAVRDDDPLLFSLLLGEVAGAGPRFSFFTVGVHERNSLRAVLRRIPHILYRSRLYLVDFLPEQGNLMSLGPAVVPYLECGRL